MGGLFVFVKLFNKFRIKFKTDRLPFVLLRGKEACPTEIFVSRAFRSRIVPEEHAEEEPWNPMTSNRRSKK